MERLTPGFGLLLWQILVLLNIILIVSSWIFILKMKEKELMPKLLMIFLTIIVPIAGAVICILLAKNHNNEMRQKA